ncbi:MAG TPA: ATP-binding cassette domain-containing protein, partial [Actinobacteria bacterium]|nr:ATP-binding cassette domain-containing protein [Actinomycetota bacterium]
MGGSGRQDRLSRRGGRDSPDLRSVGASRGDQHRRCERAVRDDRRWCRGSGDDRRGVPGGGGGRRHRRGHDPALAVRDDRAGGRVGMITVEGLSFGYRSDEAIFDGFSHVFGSGVVSGVTGRSGSGKSTLLYLVGLLLTPWSGGIHYEDIDATVLGDGERSAIRARR